jgi:hypothetical protein
MVTLISHAAEILAKAGIQYSVDSVVYWIPACAGISNGVFPSAVIVL